MSNILPFASLCVQYTQTQPHQPLFTQPHRNQYKIALLVCKILPGHTPTGLMDILFLLFHVSSKGNLAMDFSPHPYNPINVVVIDFLISQSYWLSALFKISAETSFLFQLLTVSMLYVGWNSSLRILPSLSFKRNTLSACIIILVPKCSGSKVGIRWVLLLIIMNHKSLRNLLLLMSPFCFKVAQIRMSSGKKLSFFPGRYEYSRFNYLMLNLFSKYTCSWPIGWIWLWFHLMPLILQKRPHIHLLKRLFSYNWTS